MTIMMCLWNQNILGIQLRFISIGATMLYLFIVEFVYFTAY